MKLLYLAAKMVRTKLDPGIQKMPAMMMVLLRSANRLPERYRVWAYSGIMGLTGS